MIALITAATFAENCFLIRIHNLPRLNNGKVVQRLLNKIHRKISVKCLANLRVLAHYFQIVSRPVVNETITDSRNNAFCGICNEAC